MAIFGAGSMWDGTDEMKDDFFSNNNFVIGWDISNAEDLYALVTSIKTGDILYLKANRPGSLDIRVKGIGIVRKSFMEMLFSEGEDLSVTRKNFKLPIEWVYNNEFIISVPVDTGKLTNIRAATLYEEHLPFVQNKIISKLISNLK